MGNPGRGLACLACKERKRIKNDSTSLGTTTLIQNGDHF